MRRSRRWTPVVLVAIAISVGQSALAASAHASPRRTVAVSSHFVDPGFASNPEGLDCSGATPDTCEMRYSGSSTTTGTMHGSETYDLWFYRGADGTPSVRTYETFNGTIDGCGTGSFDFIVDNVRSTPTPEHAPYAIHFDGDWRIVLGSGHGGLRGIEGGGQEHGDMALPSTENEGEFVGQVTCKPSR